MIELIFFPVVGGTRFAKFELESLRQGIDFMLFSLENLFSCKEGLSLAIQERGNESFPTIHLQQLDDSFFFQVYIGDKFGIAEEGWHCLVNNNFTPNEKDLIVTEWDDPDEGYFQARFSEGVFISKSLLISKSTLENFISKYSDDFSQLYQQGNWVDLGLI